MYIVSVSMEYKFRECESYIKSENTDSDPYFRKEAATAARSGILLTFRPSMLAHRFATARIAR